MKQLAPIQARIEALASEALEHVVEEAEARDTVKVTKVVVQVASTPLGHPALDVSVVIQREQP